MKRMYFGLALLLVLTSVGWSNETPKREMRAVWISTAWKLDFPDYSYTLGQQNEIKTKLNALKAAGINTVIFQVRPGCDAFYESSYEPWSHHVVGTYDGPPNTPYYDPLAYFIQQAHARGMELHAWFNPFRLTTGSLSSVTDNHIYKEHPEWKLNHADPDVKILNPGIPEVRDYTVDVFMDVVNRYDVDGVHMDDYFYPYEGMASEDAAEFAADPRGIGNISDWRRDNVNLFMEALYDSIQTQKPWVKLGVSPFGIWKNGVPYGIIGTSSYDQLYCDPVAWLNEGIIDYLTPQLYWPISGAQDYGKLMPWWAGQTTVNNRHLYVGHATYRIKTPTNGWPSGWYANELPRQIRMNRKTEGTLGSVHFRLKSGILDNPKGFRDSLKNDLYQYPALQPAMPWIDDIPPESPQHLSWLTGGGHDISWTSSQVAADGDTAFQYVLYRSETVPVDIDLASNILAVLPGSKNSYFDSAPGSYYYAITALDRMKNESPVARGPVSVDEIAVIPDEFILYQNFPNPFNPSTTISFDIGQAQEVRLSIYDITGIHIEDVFSGQVEAGKHEYRFDSRRPDGSPLPAGVYLARLETEAGGQVKRMLLLK